MTSYVTIQSCSQTKPHIPFLQMWSSSVRFVTQQNNILRCAWCVLAILSVSLPKRLEVSNQPSTAESVRPYSGCAISTTEVKRCPFGMQGAGVGRDPHNRPRVGQQGRAAGGALGMEDFLVLSWHLEKSVETRLLPKSTNKNGESLPGKQLVPILKSCVQDEVSI